MTGAGKIGQSTRKTKQRNEFLRQTYTETLAAAACLTVLHLPPRIPPFHTGEPLPASV
jgi:hypothetical protein